METDLNMIKIDASNDSELGDLSLCDVSGSPIGNVKQVVDLGNDGCRVKARYSVNRNRIYGLQRPFSDLPSFGGYGMLCTYKTVVDNYRRFHPRIYHRFEVLLNSSIVFYWLDSCIVAFEWEILTVHNRRFLLDHFFFKCGSQEYLVNFDFGFENYHQVCSQLNGANGEHTGLDDMPKFKNCGKGERAKFVAKEKTKKIPYSVVSVKLGLDAGDVYDGIIDELYGNIVPKILIAREKDVYYFKFQTEQLTVQFYEFLRNKKFISSARLNRSENGRVSFVDEIDFNFSAIAASELIIPKVINVNYREFSAKKNSRVEDRPSVNIINMEEEGDFLDMFCGLELEDFNGAGWVEKRGEDGCRTGWYKEHMRKSYENFCLHMFNLVKSGDNYNNLYSILRQRKENLKQYDKYQGVSKSFVVIRPTMRNYEPWDQSIMDDFYYLDYLEFDGSGWYEKYDESGEWTDDYRDRMQQRESNYYARYYGFLPLPDYVIKEFSKLKAKAALKNPSYRAKQGVTKQFRVGRPTYQGDDSPFSFSFPTFGYQNCYKEVTDDGKMMSFVFKERRGLGIDLKYFRYNEVVFREPVDFVHCDERFDSNSSGEVKHEADYVDVDINVWKKVFTGYYRNKTFSKRISKELLKQLLSPSTFHISDSYDTNYERIKRSVRTSATVNISRNNFDSGEDVANSTFLVAMYYVQHVQLANPQLIGELDLN